MKKVDFDRKIALLLKEAADAGMTMDTVLQSLQDVLGSLERAMFMGRTDSEPYEAPDDHLGG